MYVRSSMDVTAGQSVELMCNTSLTDDIMWTYDTGNGYVHYVYWNGHVDEDRPRLAVKSTAVGSHSLVISDAEQKDSGLYDCYDGKEARKGGYQVIIAGMYVIIIL